MMRASAEIAALLLATVVGAAAQSNWPPIYTDKHGSETNLQVASSGDNFSAQQSPAGTSSSKQRTATSQTTPSTSKPATAKPNPQSGTAASKSAGSSTSKASLT